MKTPFVVLVVTAVGALARPSAAYGDRRELYTTLSLEPGWALSGDPLSGEGVTGAPAIGVNAAAYYGLSNTVHLGAVVRLGYSRDFTYDRLNVVLPDGTSSRGRLFYNRSQVGFSALGRYRFDTGGRWAPVMWLEVGLVHEAASGIEHIPQGSSFGIFFADRRETALSCRSGIELEYRLSERWVLGLGAAIAGSPGRQEVQMALPAKVGVVW